MVWLWNYGSMICVECAANENYINPSVGVEHGHGSIACVYIYIYIYIHVHIHVISVNLYIIYTHKQTYVQIYSSAYPNHIHSISFKTKKQRMILYVYIKSCCLGDDYY